MRRVDDAERAYDTADREDAEEIYGRYQELVEHGTEALGEMRDAYSRTLDAAGRRGVRGRVQPDGRSNGCPASGSRSRTSEISGGRNGAPAGSESPSCSTSARRRASGARVSISRTRTFWLRPCRSKRPRARTSFSARTTGAELLVHGRRDDQVHLAELVLEQHEDDAFCGRRPLAGDDHSGHRHLRPVECQRHVMAREDIGRKVRAQELQRVDADRDARRPVVGEHPLPVGRLREHGGLDRRIERQRQLPRLAARPRNRRRARRKPASQISGRASSPKEAQAPDSISAWSPSRRSGARCARSRTSRNGPPRSRSSTRAFASSSPTDVTYSIPIRTAPTCTEHLASLRGSRPAEAPPPRAAAHPAPDVAGG